MPGWNDGFRPTPCCRTSASSPVPRRPPYSMPIGSSRSPPTARGSPRCGPNCSLCRRLCAALKTRGRTGPTSRTERLTAIDGGLIQCNIDDSRRRLSMRYFALPLLLTLAACQPAAPDPRGVDHDETLLTVTASGRADATPDEARIQLGVQSLAGSADEASRANRDKMEK